MNPTLLLAMSGQPWARSLLWGPWAGHNIPAWLRTSGMYPLHYVDTAAQQCGHSDAFDKEFCHRGMVWPSSGTSILRRGYAQHPCCERAIHYIWMNVQTRFVNQFFTIGTVSSRHAE